jgi:cytochrome c553
MSFLAIRAVNDRKGDQMRHAGFLTAVLAVSAVAASGLAQAPNGKDLLWAFPVAGAVVNKPPVPPIEGPQQLAGSDKSYTQEELDKMDIAVDWFPANHKPLPKIVRDGADDGGFACGSCHLANGMGHPESSALTGLSRSYFIRTMRDLKSGRRKDPIRMTQIAQNLSDKDMREAAAYFSALKPVPGWVKVVESATVPKTYLGQGRMRFIDPDESGTEPIGSRIIMLPDDPVRARARDPGSGFTAYAPPGSLARGRFIAMGEGGKLPACATCHGPRLRGMGPAPNIAGTHPIYLVRQLYNFQTGARRGANAQMMKPIVSHLSDRDIVAVAAYVSSLRR